MKNAHLAILNRLENILSSDALHYDRLLDQIIVNIPYKWSKFCLIFSLNEELGMLQISASCDLTINEEKEDEVFKLLALANDKLLMGHFSYDFDFKTPVYRYCLPLGNEAISEQTLADVKDYMLEEFHRFYLSFFYVAYGNKSANSSLISAMVDCAGVA